MEKEKVNEKELNDVNAGGGAVYNGLSVDELEKTPKDKDSKDKIKVNQLLH